MVNRVHKTGRTLALTSLAALAAGLAAGAAQAQSVGSYRAAPATVVSGTVNQTQGLDTDTFTINSPTAVIDFTPFDTAIDPAHTPINFQTGTTTATYRNGAGVTDFTVLNRIVPVDTSRPVAFNGNVVSEIQIGSAPAVRGGTVWFYSPGGIVIADGAVFDIGNLLLTTRDPTNGTGVISSTSTFTAGGTGDAIVNVLSDATINADKAGSYVALVAPIVYQAGTVNVNGSAAYVAAEQATLSFSGGLFSINVTTGSDGGTTSTNFPLQHLGITRGPSNIVNADNHGIYLVSVPKNDAVTMIVAPRGQLGFDVAGSASVQNGQVILAAGRNVVNGVIDDGTRPSVQAANLQIDAGSLGDGHFTSMVNARATDIAQIRPFSGQSLRFDQGLTLVGGTQAFIDLQPGGSFQAAGGNVRVQAIGAGGTASARSGVGATLSVTNDLTVRADKIGLSLSGPATPDPTSGGAATIQANVGTIIAGTATVASVVSGGGGQALTGGIAQFGSLNGGTLTIGGPVTVDARVTRTGATSGAGGSSTGGIADLRVTANSTMSVNGAFNVLTTVTGGDGATGGNATGATARLTIDTGGQLSVTGPFSLIANSIGGAGATGGGGNATGGITGASVVVDNGALSVTGAFTVAASGIGGAGTTGGSASGGNASITITANRGSITAGDTSVDASEVGGAGSAGAGGAATGGSARVTIDTPTGTGATPQMQFASLFTSGAATGGAGTGGAGGTAFGGTSVVSNNTDTTFSVTNAITGTVEAIGGAATGNFAGGDARGGSATFSTGATANVSDVTLIGRVHGGNKNGGTGNAGTAIGGATFVGAFGGQLISTGTVNIDSSATGGSVLGASTGQGGAATAGDAQVAAQFGAQVTVANIFATSNAIGGDSRGVTAGSDAAGSTAIVSQGNGGRVDVSGSVTLAGDALGGAIRAGTGTGVAGTGRGGDVRFASNDGTITAGSVSLSAQGTGGNADGATAGDGVGGNTNIGADTGLTSVGGNARLDSSAYGGNATGTGGSGGNALGGATVYVGTIGSGQITIGGTTQLIADSHGGNAIGAGKVAGAATGGRAEEYVLAGTIHNVGQTSITANAYGGAKTDATAGTAGIAAGGSASLLGLGGTLTLDGALLVYAGGYSQTPGTATNEGATSGGTATVTSTGGSIGVAGSTFVYAGATRTYPTLYGDNAATNGGTASIVANGGTIALGNNVTVMSDASAQDSGTSVAPIPVQAGSSRIQAVGGDITLGNNVLVSATGSAQTIAPLGRGVGLPVAGGTVDFSAAVGRSLTAGDVTLSADAIGGSIFVTGPALFGGTGGTVTATALGSITTAALSLSAQGIGGDKILGATGSSGTGTGGGATLRAQGGTFTVNGDLSIDASARGGSNSFLVGGGTSDGGAGIGGGARMDTVGTGSIIQVSGNVAINANGTGTDGRGAGANGGRGQAGASPDAGPYTDGAYLVSTIGDISIGGDATLTAVGTGGDGALAGGTGMGGLANILAVNGTITLTDFNGTATLDASGIGGNAVTNGTTFGGGAGGAGIGDRAVLSSATDANGPSSITIANVTAVASGVGGAGAAGLSGTTGTIGGDGGAGTAGSILAIAEVGNGHWITNVLQATASGQGGAGGAGGAASGPVQGANAGRGGVGTGGQATVGLVSGIDSVDNDGVVTLGSVTTTVNGTGGAGANGGAGGTQSTPGPNGTTIFYTVQGDGSDGGDARGGNASIIASGGQLAIDTLTMNAVGQGGGGGTGNSVGIGGRGEGGGNVITVSNRFNRGERGSLTVFSVNSDTGGKYDASSGSIYGTAGGGTAISVTGGDADIGNINTSNDGFDPSSTGNDTRITVDDGTLNIQQAFLNAVGDVTVSTSATGVLHAGSFDVYTSGSLLFADPADPVAMANFIVDNDLFLSLGGNFTAPIPLTFGGSATIYAGDIQTSNITANGSVNLNGYFSVSTGTIIAGNTISLHTDNSGGSSDIVAGNLTAAGNSVSVVSQGGNITVGNVGSGGAITLDAAGRIQAGSLTGADAIDISSTSGPITVGDTSGGAIDILTDDDNGTADSITTGNLVATSGIVSVASRGNAVTTGSVNASDSIFINATNAINTGTLATGSGGAGFIGVSTDNGPVVVGDVSGSDISIVSNDERDSAGSVTTGNLTASIYSVVVQSAGGTVSTGIIQAGADITVGATNGITAGALSAGTNGGSVDGLAVLSTESGSITIGNASGGALAIRGGNDGNVATGALTARNLEIHSLGALSTGDVSVLASIPSDIAVQPVVALTSVGDLTTGTIAADRLIALASTGGSLRTGIVSTTGSFAGFAAQNVTLGGVTTGTGPTDSLFLSNASILTSNPDFAALNPVIAASTFDPATLARSTPVPVAGSITIGGPVVTGNLIGAAAGAVQLGAVSGTNRIALGAGTTFTAGDISTPGSYELTSPGSITTGAIDAGDVLLVSTGGSVNTGIVRSGRDLILLASGGITLGGATTGLAAPAYPGSVYLASASQRSLIAGSNRAPLLAATPVATGGPILIAGAVTAGALKAASGTTFTAQRAVTASGDIAIDSAGLATIGGAISAPSIQIASSDIALTGSLNASSANTLRLVARGGSAGVRFGGDGSGGGYNLSATEAALLRSPNIVFQADGDVLVGAVTLNGSASATGANLLGSSGKLTITSPGTIRVNGALQLNNMASGNRLTLNATRRVEVATDLGGSIILLGGTTADQLGGTAELIGNTIAIGSSNLLTQLASNPRFAGRDAALAAAAATPRPAGYLQANRIELAGVDTIAIQNSGTGSAEGYAGFTAGSGGMEVRTALGSATSVATPMDLAIFGRVQGTSDFLTGAQTRTGITFTNTPGTAGFTASSSVNGCLISTGDCPSPIPVIPPEVVMIAPNIAAIAPKLIDVFLDAATMPELRVAPGIDQSALIIESLIDEPVSSGGNPSFWSGPADGGAGSAGEAVTGTGNPDTGNGNRTRGTGNPATGTGNRPDGAGNPATGTGNGAQGAGNPVAGAGSRTGTADTPAPGAGTGAPNADTPAPGTGDGTPGSGNPATGTGDNGQRRPGDGEF